MLSGFHSSGSPSTTFCWGENWLWQSRCENETRRSCYSQRGRAVSPQPLTAPTKTARRILPTQWCSQKPHQSLVYISFNRFHLSSLLEEITWRINLVGFSIRIKKLPLSKVHSFHISILEKLNHVKIHWLSKESVMWISLILYDSLKDPRHLVFLLWVIALLTFKELLFDSKNLI